MKLRKYTSWTTDVYNQWDTATIFLLVIKGAIVGAVGGFAAATFRYVIEQSEAWRAAIESHLTVETAIGWLALMAVLGVLTHYLLKWAPLSGGSGIPQIEGEMHGVFDMAPYPTMISKYVGGFFTGICGFSVGREGPSVQLSGSIGKAIAKLFKSTTRETRILTSAGAGAGLTAAFSAPISGAIFVFEEVHKSFYPMLIIPTFTATLTANYMASLVFGLEPSLGFTVVQGLPIKTGPYLLLLGVAIGLIGVCFNKAVIGFKKLYAHLPIPPAATMALTFMIVALIGMDSQLLLGGGHHLVGELAFIRHSYWLLVFIIFGKILITAFCYGSGAQGGIFMPMLVIGASMGALAEESLVRLGLIPDMYLANFVICAMGGMLASAMRTPLLSILLVMEMTGSFHSIYDVGIVTIVAYLVAQACHEKPIYDALLELMTKGIKVVAPHQEQTFFETKVPILAQYVGLPLKDMNLPKGIVIISVDRCGQHIVPCADTILQESDELYVSCMKGQLEEAKAFFQV